MHNNRNENYTTKAYNQIIDKMIDGIYKPGDKISDAELTKELGFSRTPVREALILLERDGFIYTVVGKGSYVAEKNMEFVREEQLRIVEEHISKAVAGAKAGGISIEELQEIMRMIYEEV